MENPYLDSSVDRGIFDKKYPSLSEATVDDEVVWEKFKKGDKAALTYIYRNYANPLYNYGCQLTSKEIVKDAIHDLFIEIINNKERLGNTNSIKYYLFKSLRNKLVKVLTKMTKEQSGDMGDAYPFAISLSPELVLINQQIDEEKRSMIAAKLNELPPLQKEALLLFYYEGLKYDQIASLLGMKVKSARALVYRGIDSMSKLLIPVRKNLL